MTKTRKIGIALVTVLAMLLACVCGAFTVAAEEEPVVDYWYVTEDGQFLYSKGVYTDDSIEVIYIGDSDDVTVPASFGGTPAEKIWLASDVTWNPDIAENPYFKKAVAASQRYLNITFEEGPTIVWVTPHIAPSYVRVNSVTLPKSAQTVTLHLKGATAVTAPEGSELTSILIENVLEGVEDPQPTTIDLTGATGLKRVNISRVDYGGECFLEGSVLKLPDSFKRVRVKREFPYYAPEDDMKLVIDYEPMPLTIEYADGSGRPVTFSGDADSNDQVDMKDVLLIRQYIAGIAHVELWDGLFMLGADMNHDGEVNMKDVLLIRRFIAGLT
ncbi:MAG: dockerin type I repeat-containing protein [Clostridia bacterium]|nr:dockerin type I repeat-containing protein [Clostridia bacterium]